MAAKIPPTGRGSSTPYSWDWASGGWTATRGWVAKQLPADRSVRESTALRGGCSSQMRRLTLDDGTGLVLRSFAKPFYRRHAAGLLAREASVLTLLAPYEDLPTPELHAVDAAAEHCDHPSLVDVLAAGRRTGRRGGPGPARRPAGPPTGPYPRGGSGRPPTPLPGMDLARTRPCAPGRAVGAGRGRDPALNPRRTKDVLLHRDFHPGNVLFTGAGDTLRISGVVDWVETWWGPADLDVATASTALALLHGEAFGLGSARYEAHGRTPTGRRRGALVLAAAGRAGLLRRREARGAVAGTGARGPDPELLGNRLTAYVTGLFELAGVGDGDNHKTVAGAGAAFRRVGTPCSGPRRR